MKKISVLLSAIFVLVLTGCSGTVPSTISENEKPLETGETSGNGMGDVAYIGTKSPSEAKEVGDIVFTDGSSMAYSAYAALPAGDEKTAKKNAAIALIFYKGEYLYSESEAGSRTLGVGLKHNKSGLVWCTANANAYNVNISTIRCNLYTEELSSIFRIDGDVNGSDNLEQITAFDGIDDTVTQSRYPAFYFGKNYKYVDGSRVSGTAYESGWYLPSIAELCQIYYNGIGKNKMFDLDLACYALGGDKFDISTYWSSSQYNASASMACAIYFNGDVCGYPDKNDTYNVCCIREFN